MTDSEELDQRLHDSFRDLGDQHAPDVSDPGALADQILSRPVTPTASSAASNSVAPTATRTTLWKMLGGLTVVALAGVGTGAWIGSSGTSGGSDNAVARATDLPTTQLWRCPDNGVVGRLTSGDRILLTGRSADGTWVRLRDPGNLDDHVWTVAATVDPDNSIDDLPEAECDDPTANPDIRQLGATAAPLTDPDTTTSTPGPDGSTVAVPVDTTPDDMTTTSTTTPGPAPTTTVRPGPSPTTTRPTRPIGPTTTTVAPDRTGPAISGVTSNPTTIWTEDPWKSCPPEKSARTVSLSATVNDPSGVASVRAVATVNGHSKTVTMTRSGSAWRATIGPFAYDTLPDNGSGMVQTVNVTITATDGAQPGNTSTRTTSFTLRSAGECFG